MPAQQTRLEIVCLLCDGLITDDGNEIDQLHDDCVSEYTDECMSCGSTGVDTNNYYNFTRQVRSLITENIGVISFRSAYDTNEIICEDCRWECSECDRTYQYEESMLECCSASGLLNYSWKPPYWKFWKQLDSGSHWTRTHEQGELYMGIELEMTNIASCSDEFLDMCGEDRDNPYFLFFKEDGSVGYNGGELVTMPATLEAFANKFPFDVLDEGRRMFRLRSYAYESCGFHIHVNRDAFTPSHLWKFVKFQLNNHALCVEVGQRDSNVYASWHFEEKENRDLPDYVKGKKSNGRRYLAINFQNRATVELRYFKGNLLKPSIMKNLEFVQSIYDYTKNMPYSSVVNGALSHSAYLDWLSGQEKYENLRMFLSVGQTRSED
jgi:hypothetical protein